MGFFERRNKLNKKALFIIVIFIVISGLSVDYFHEKNKEREEEIGTLRQEQKILLERIETLEEKNLFSFPRMPEEITFCKEKVPLEKEYVRERLLEALIIEINKSLDMRLIFLRTGRWFPFIESELRLEDLPIDLKYLVVIESNLNHMANSSKGARGLWQFDRRTARQRGLRCGLRRDLWIDERYDPYSSTEAAIKYLKELYVEFGSWPSVFAAYNMNKDKYKEKLEEQETDSFYQVRQIPRETQRFVYRAIAVKLIMENPEKYGYPSWEIVNKKKYEPWEILTRKLIVEGSRNSRKSIIDIVKELKGKHSNLTHRKFLDYNPHILQGELPPGTYTTYIPREKIDPRLFF